mgnify:CR=1 FL=1
MDLYEYQAKELFATHGVTTQVGKVVSTPADAQKAAALLQKAEIDALKENALKVADLENKMNAMLLLLDNKQELTVKQD